VLATAVVLAVAAGCAGDDTTATQPDSSVAGDEIAIDVGHVTGPIDRRLLGTNVPAWVRPEKLADPKFQELAVASGASVVRMPGGSWSSSYDWLACENGDADTCYWTWAARPSDFIGFLAATGLEGMWTVSFGGTAQEAAALVAFFNGDAGDTREIGIDRRGRDWGTVGQWASLRAEHGHPQPQRVQMWEVGNEVFGARRDTAGGSCFEFGWEDVWTCDGEDYVHGDDEHDGFLDFRTAMQAVDPSIDVGAVGVSPPDSWGGFGNEVIDGTAGAMDFYVLHDYPFSGDTDVDDILEQPQRSWPRVVDALTPTLDSVGATDVPIAVTEYGWISSIDADTGAKLTQAVNALYVADLIGQMAASGVRIANQWNFGNGAASTGADYGMVDLEDDSRYPQYYALAMWSRVGTDLLQVSSGFDAATTLSAYATVSPDGTLTLLAVNKTGETVEARVRLDGATGPFRVTADVAGAAAADATSMTFNGVVDPPVDLTEVAALPVADATDSFTYAFVPYSITAVRLTPAS
jgi:alpha-L-arabinofuranosidase